MSEFFSGIYGARFPDVVFNSGPLPPSGGLPAPLHDTPDARINYNSTLLGDLTPYAYGEPGYQSSQSAFLNIPHRVQKIVPVLDLPTAKPGTKDTFDLSHPVDDSDVAFVLRLDRKSLFCSGLRNVSFSRAGLSTQVDALVNLATLNYILSGIQLGVRDTSDHWYELLHNADPRCFPKDRDLDSVPMNITDLLHFVRFLATPFGVVRGSEKQGGQNEATQSPATWPVCFVATLVIDGKEGNVVNVWHHHNVHAGDDLVLRLKPVPLKEYTLNHYYKRLTRAKWDTDRLGGSSVVWQLVPDVFTLDAESLDEKLMQKLPINFGEDLAGYAWQELGYWHIGRAQVMAGKHVHEEYYFNDMANQMKTHHLDMTFEPTWQCLGNPWRRPGGAGSGGGGGGGSGSGGGGGSGSGGAGGGSGGGSGGNSLEFYRSAGSGPSSSRGFTPRRPYDGQGSGPRDSRDSTPRRRDDGRGSGGADGGLNPVDARGAAAGAAMYREQTGAVRGRPQARAAVADVERPHAGAARILRPLPPMISNQGTDSAEASAVVADVNRPRAGAAGRRRVEYWNTFSPDPSKTRFIPEQSPDGVGGPGAAAGGAAGSRDLPPTRDSSRLNVNTRRPDALESVEEGSASASSDAGAAPSGGSIWGSVKGAVTSAGKLIGIREETMSEDGQALATETDAAPAAPLGEAAAGGKRRVSFGAPGAGVDLSDLLQPRKGKKASRGAGSSSSVIEGSLLGADGSETAQPMSLL